MGKLARSEYVHINFCHFIGTNKTEGCYGANYLRSKSQKVNHLIRMFHSKIKHYDRLPQIM